MWNKLIRFLTGKWRNEEEQTFQIIWMSFWAIVFGVLGYVYVWPIIRDVIENPISWIVAAIAVLYLIFVSKDYMKNAWPF
jgi:hypothetical protein